MNNFKYHVSEIFYSIQGEGFFSGHAAVFVRTAGCNLTCSFCDTDHTPKENLTAIEIAAKVKALFLLELQQFNMARTRVVITGGEPTIHNLRPLLEALRAVGVQFIHLETNGTNVICEGFDWVTVSPKQELSMRAYVCIGAPDEFKFLLGSKGFFVNPEPYQVAFTKSRFYLQPIDGDEGSLEAAVALCKARPGTYALSVQLHKLLNLK